LILAIDVYYYEEHANVAGVLFNWLDTVPQSSITTTVHNIAPYVPGQFYKREMPCILKLLEQVDLEQLEAVLVDSHVYITNNKDYGLGGHLWEALGGKTPIIGVAKRSFHNTDKVTIPITRGKSANPLYVSAIGMETTAAAQLVTEMVGEYRIPKLLKIVDELSRG